MLKFKKLIFFILYNLLASKLPKTLSPLQFGQNKFRIILCKMMGAKIGNNVNIECNVNFTVDLKQISIGNNSCFGINSRIGLVEIGDNVLMAPDCLIITDNHSFERKDLPIKAQGYSGNKKVVIDDDVWIGQRVIILGGVFIGKGAVIGAGSVVTKDIEAYTVNAGNPCKKIRDR